MAYIRGRVERVLHQNGTYCVFSFKVEETDFAVRDSSTVVSGHLCGMAKVLVGAAFEVVGEWIRHPKWGRQFAPRGWHPWAKSVYDIRRFISDSVPGIENWDLCGLIVKAYGMDTYDKLSKEPQEVLGLLQAEDPLRQMLEDALLRWDSSRALSDLSIFLQGYDLGPDAVTGVFSKFGRDAIAIISGNPYRLIAVDSFNFSKADHLALRLGIGRDDPRRVEGAILWLLRLEAREGHLYARRSNLPSLLREMESTEHIDSFETSDLESLVTAAVERLHTQGAIQIDPEAGVYLPDLFRYERVGAVKLSEFLTPSEIDIDLLTFLQDYQRSNQIELSAAQQDAVQKLIQNRVLVLTGLPGTGKTTVIRTFVRLFKDKGISFTLMAPTGIAAKRLASVTGEDAGTIHRTLRYSGTEWGYNSALKFNTGAVIVDEMSMVDQELFFRIIDALHPSTMLILVGDDAQLPSVGPGNVLRELISCEVVPNVRLTQIFRQVHTSAIVIASHKINSGDTPLPDTRDPASEFQFVSDSDEERIVNFIVDAAVKLKGRDSNFQVLSPKYEGVTGVKNLNERLRDRLNPGGVQKEWKAGSLYVREGDRLMVVQNNYKLNVYNGDMGKLIAIDKDSLAIRVHGIGAGVSDVYVHIPKGLATTMLRLAYAITVHKSQGSEFDTVLMPIVRGHGRMLQRNLFYTGITRARKKVWLLGEVASVLKAVANDKVVQRNTVFGRVVTEEVGRALAGVVEASHDRSGEETGPVRPPDT